MRVSNSEPSLAVLANSDDEDESLTRSEDSNAIPKQGLSKQADESDNSDEESQPIAKLIPIKTVEADYYKTFATKSYTYGILRCKQCKSSDGKKSKNNKWQLNLVRLEGSNLKLQVVDRKLRKEKNIKVNSLKLTEVGTTISVQDAHLDLLYKTDKKKRFLLGINTSGLNYFKIQFDSLELMNEWVTAMCLSSFEFSHLNLWYTYKVIYPSAEWAPIVDTTRNDIYKKLQKDKTNIKNGYLHVRFPYSTEWVRLFLVCHYSYTAVGKSYELSNAMIELFETEKCLKRVALIHKITNSYAIVPEDWKIKSVTTHKIEGQGTITLPKYRVDDLKEFNSIFFMSPTQEAMMQWLVNFEFSLIGSKVEIDNPKTYTNLLEPQVPHLFLPLSAAKGDPKDLEIGKVIKRFETSLSQLRSNEPKVKVTEVVKTEEADIKNKEATKAESEESVNTNTTEKATPNNEHVPSNPLENEKIVEHIKSPDSAITMKSNDHEPVELKKSVPVKRVDSEDEDDEEETESEEELPVATQTVLKPIAPVSQSVLKPIAPPAQTPIPNSLKQNSLPQTPKGSDVASLKGSVRTFQTANSAWQRATRVMIPLRESVSSSESESDDESEVQYVPKTEKTEKKASDLEEEDKPLQRVAQEKSEGSAPNGNSTFNNQLYLGMMNMPMNMMNMPMNMMNMNPMAMGIGMNPMGVGMNPMLNPMAMNPMMNPMAMNTMMNPMMNPMAMNMMNANMMNANMMNMMNMNMDLMMNQRMQMMNNMNNMNGISNMNNMNNTMNNSAINNTNNTDTNNSNNSNEPPKSSQKPMMFRSKSIPDMLGSVELDDFISKYLEFAPEESISLYRLKEQFNKWTHSSKFKLSQLCSKLEETGCGISVVNPIAPSIDEQLGVINVKFKYAEMNTPNTAVQASAAPISDDVKASIKESQYFKSKSLKERKGIEVLIEKGTVKEIVNVIEQAIQREKRAI